MIFSFCIKSYAEEKSVKLIGQWPLNYSAKDIAIDNERKYIYLGDGECLSILDIDLTLIAETPITSSDQIDGMFYSSSSKYIYAACKYDGLRIVDVSDVETPLEVGAYDHPNALVEIIGVYVDNQRAYLACGTSGVLILDVSDPRAPHFLKEVELPGALMVYSYSVDIYADGDYTWVGDLLNGIRIINVKDLENPKLTNILLPNVRDLFVSGLYLYAAVEANGMQIIDISDPEKPKQKSIFLTSGNAEAVRVDDNWAYIAYSFGSAGIRILDVTDKTNPMADKNWAYTGSDVKSIGMFPGDTSLYATSDQADMKKIDISDKTNMHAVGSFDTPADSIAIDISGDYIYSIDDKIGNNPEKEGLRVFQIVFPNPESVKFQLNGFCKTPGEASDVFVMGRYVYLADGNNGLQIIDVEDKNNPKIVGNVLTDGFAQSVYVNLNYAYVANGDQGIDIIDVTDSTNPRIVSHLNTAGTANDIASKGDYAYIANGDNGLQIIDVKDKTNPKIINNLKINGAALGIYIENLYLYIAAGYQGIFIINIADKTNPILISSYNTPGYAKKNSASGIYLYVADGKSGVSVINISDRTHPIKDSELSFDKSKGHGGNALDVFSGYSDEFENLYAFVADDQAGIVALHLNTNTENNNNGQSGGGGGGGCFIQSLFISNQ
jgi:hypothetical protein